MDFPRKFNGGNSYRGGGSSSRGRGRGRNLSGGGPGDPNNNGDGLRYTMVVFENGDYYWKPEVPKIEKKSNLGWTKQEDEDLCELWMSPGLSDDASLPDRWAGTVFQFEERHGYCRSREMMESRRMEIINEVTPFNEIYKYLLKNYPNTLDTHEARVMESCKLYKLRYKQSFEYLGCWEFLKVMLQD